MTARYTTRKNCSLLLAAVTIAALAFSCRKEEKLPNIVYILADDLGYGDISSLNPGSAISTPHIDRLASEGMTFLDAHSGSSVCSPTRYGILTGRYAWRTRLKSGVLWSWDPPLVENDRLTVASMLKEAGYSTACIGKWHLGLGWEIDSLGKGDLTKPLSVTPNSNGFDYSFIITASLDIPPYVYIENDRVTARPDRVTGDTSKYGWWRFGETGSDFVHGEVLQKFTEKAIEWIRQQKDGDKPFFLYLPLPAPHTPILPSEEFRGTSGTNPYGDFVVMVDHMIGKIDDRLREDGFSENTILIVTSDNGCSPEADFEELARFGHDPGYIFRGHKADIYEGGHRIPLIVRWPGEVSPGTCSGQITVLTDLMATLAEITAYSLPGNAGEDSFSILPVLLGNSVSSSRQDAIHHSIDGYFSIRRGKWKLELCRGSGGWSYPTESQAALSGMEEIQLYDLETDPGELDNVAGDNGEIVDELLMILKEQVARGRSTPGEDQPFVATGDWPDRYLRLYRR